MSRHLPPRPSFEHLRKQAKELLPELQRQQPRAKLADAQHAVAVGYGFGSWPALKARVEALAAERPLAGAWRMNPARSRTVAEYRVAAATLRIGVAGDTITFTDVVVDPSGRETRTVNAVCADGAERTFEQGYAVSATWRTGSVLEMTMKKDGRHVSAFTYEVAAGGDSLTIAASSAAHDGYPAVETVSVFDRVSVDGDGE